MASRLGTYAWIHPDTRVFVPEVAYTSIPEGHTAVPLRGHAHTCAVLGPLTTEGHAVVGWCMVGIMDADVREVLDVHTHVPKAPPLPTKVGNAHKGGFWQLMWPW
jgi:hypothetical protein